MDDVLGVIRFEELQVLLTKVGGSLSGCAAPTLAMTSRPSLRPSCRLSAHPSAALRTTTVGS